MKQVLNIRSNALMKSRTAYRILQKSLQLPIITLKMCIMQVELVQLLMSCLKKPGAFNGDCLTVSGKTFRENVAGCEILDTECYSSY